MTFIPSQLSAYPPRPPYPPRQTRQTCPTSPKSPIRPNCPMCQNRPPCPIHPSHKICLPGPTSSCPMSSSDLSDLSTFQFSPPPPSSLPKSFPFKTRPIVARILIQHLVEALSYFTFCQYQKNNKKAGRLSISPESHFLNQIAICWIFRAQQNCEKYHFQLCLFFALLKIP